MKKILLIDDNEPDRMLYKRYLGKQIGHERLEIHEAASGEEGLAQFAALQPDCVLLDYNLLDCDGLEVLDGLKQLAPVQSLCVVMITGGGNETLAVRALNNGALDYLVKSSFDQEMLCKTVTHAIEKNEWRQYEGRYHAEMQGVNQQLRDSLQELTEARRQLTTANEEIQARNRALARSNADLDNFVYAASHDLRQPVDNLRGLFDELRLTATLDDPDQKQVLCLIDASLNGLSTTINDLAAVVRVENLAGEQVTESITLDGLADEVLQTLRPQLLATNADVQLNFSALPALLYVRSNLRTVLLNLLSNAVKYRHPERSPQVQVRSRWVAGQALLEIEDNGLGIDLQRHGAELFQLFRRFHAQASDGTGVGLFLVNRIVQAHGGHIEVESQPNAGATFRVYLGSQE